MDYDRVVASLARAIEVAGIAVLVKGTRASGSGGYTLRCASSSPAG